MLAFERTSRGLSCIVIAASVSLAGRAARAQCKNGDDLYIAVAVSGGGFRAAAFGDGILQGLRHIDLPPGVLPHRKSRKILDNVDLISAVSGGSIAAAYWAANRPPGQFAELLAKTDVVGRLHQQVLARAWKDLQISHIFLPWTDSPFTRLLKWKGLATSPMVEDIFQTFIPKSLTFSKIRRLKINTLNLSGMRTFVFPDDLPCAGVDPTQFPVLNAVVASSSLPGVFEPFDLRADPARLSDMLRDGTIPARCEHRVSEKVTDNLLADGGLVDNLGLSEIIREITARKRTEAGRGLRALVILVNANVDSSPDKTPADGKDIVADAFDRMIQDRTRDSIDAVRDYLSLYGIQVLEFNIHDLKKSLSEGYHQQLDDWSLGAMEPQKFIQEVIAAAAFRVKVRRQEIYERLNALCSERVSSNAPGRDGLPPPLDAGSFFDWRPDWNVDDDFILSTIATDAYRHGKDLIEAQRKYVSRQARLEADLAAETHAVDSLTKSWQDAEAERDQKAIQLKQLEAEKERILQDKASSEAAAKARIEELNRLTQNLGAGIALSSQRIDALTKQMAAANSTLNVLRETREAIDDGSHPKRPPKAVPSAPRPKQAVRQVPVPSPKPHLACARKQGSRRAPAKAKAEPETAGTRCPNLDD